MKKTKRIFTAVCTALILSAAPTTVGASTLKDEVYLGTNESGVNILLQALLPNSVYRFPILASVNSLRPVQLTSKDIDNMYVDVKAVTGVESIKSVNVVTEDGLGFVELETGCADYFDNAKVNLQLSVVSGDGNITASTLQTMEVGYQTAKSSDIEALCMGKSVIVDAQRPIYTESQLTRISEILNHDTVNFVGKMWNYSNVINNDKSINMCWNTSTIPEVAKANPSADMYFLSFPATPKFDNEGTLEIDMAIAHNISTKPLVYKYTNGKLTKVKYEYDEKLDRIVFKASELGTYVLSDKEIYM